MTVAGRDDMKILHIYACLVAMLCAKVEAHTTILLDVKDGKVMTKWNGVSAPSSADLLVLAGKCYQQDPDDTVFIYAGTSVTLKSILGLGGILNKAGYGWSRISYFYFNDHKRSLTPILFDMGKAIPYNEGAR